MTMFPTMVSCMVTYDAIYNPEDQISKSGMISTILHETRNDETRNHDELSLIEKNEEY